MQQHYNFVPWGVEAFAHSSQALSFGILHFLPWVVLRFRERVVLPTLPPSASALVPVQAGPHTAVPMDLATTLEPHAMQLTLRWRLRLPLHLSSRRCGPSPGCGAQVDASRAAPTHPRNGSSMPDDAARVARAAALVHLAPGSEATLAELRDPARRPSEPYGPIACEVFEFQPPEPCPLPLAAFEGLRGARRGSAAFGRYE